MGPFQLFPCTHRVHTGAAGLPDSGRSGTPRGPDGGAGVPAWHGWPPTMLGDGFPEHERDVSYDLLVYSLTKRDDGRRIPMPLFQTASWRPHRWATCYGITNPGRHLGWQLGLLFVGAMKASKGNRLHLVFHVILLFPCPSPVMTYTLFRLPAQGYEKAGEPAFADC